MVGKSACLMITKYIYFIVIYIYTNEQFYILAMQELLLGISLLNTKMSTLLSLVAPVLVILKTYGSTIDDNIGIMTTFDFSWLGVADLSR